MFDFNTNEGYFLHLLKCALKSEQPMEAPDGIDFAKVLELSKRHDVENITFLSVDRLENKPNDALYLAWQEAYFKRLKHCAFQDMALDELIKTFTSKGIDCMPLKGSVIKNYYSSPDLRTMGDIDFLVREQNRQVIRDIMHSLGYEDDILDDGQVDGFKRGNLDYIEIHYDFSAKNHVYHETFTIDWDKLVQTDTSHLFRQTFEDLYFFNVGHYAKNMHNRGMGIRAVIDGFVLWDRMTEEQKQGILDRIEDIELSEFHNKLLQIADIWFDDKSDDGSTQVLQEYLLSKPTYSSKKDEITMYAIYDEADDSNFKYVIRKIFPSVNELYRRFDIKHRCFLLIPFLWIARIFSQLFGNKAKWDKAKEQMDNFKAIDNDSINYEKKIRQEFGLTK